VRQDFSTTYEDSRGTIFQPWETGYFNGTPREQNAINFLACPTGKYHSAYSPYTLNDLNLALTVFSKNWHNMKKKLRSFFLSWMDAMSEKTISRYRPFKGTVSRDFSLLVFFINQFPPSPRVSH
jgi:hypothetical protein